VKLKKTEDLLRLALQRIAELEERLNKNSKNSSKPPSSDQKPNSENTFGLPRASREGINRNFVPPERVDSFVSCTLINCPHCGSSDIIDDKKFVCLQQVELPEVNPTITQYNCNKYTCAACSCRSVADLPRGVPNSTFGPKLMALIASLTGVFHLSKREVIQLVKDLYHIEVCEGSIINIEERVSTSIHDVYERIRHVVMKSIACKHFDETSWRNNGKNKYAWVACTSEAVCFGVGLSRSKEAFRQFVGILGNSPSVTDRYAAYHDLGRDHQYCLAHLIRDFHQYAERYGPDGEIGQAVEKELRKVCKIQSEFRREQISLKGRNLRLHYCRKRVEMHLIDGYASGSEELSRFCEKMLNEFDKWWTFTRFNDVDPTNNLAERDLRKLVLWRKKSYGTRSERGQRFVERITSIAETVKRTGKNVLTFIEKAVIDFYSGVEAPYICLEKGF